MANTNQSNDLSSNDKNSLSHSEPKLCSKPPQEKYEYGYVQVDNSAIKVIKDGDASLLYGLIDSLSTQQPWAYCSNEYLCDRFGWDLRKVQRLLALLEEKKFIYRNIWKTSGGSERHMVTMKNALNYYEQWILSHPVPEDRRDHYEEEFLKFHSPNYYSKFKNRSHVTKIASEPSHVTSLSRAKHVTSLARASLTKVNDIEESDDNIGAPPPLYAKDTNKSTKTDPPTNNPTSTHQTLKIELEKTFGNPADVSLGMEYYALNQEQIDQKDNPIAAVVHAIKEGYALTNIEKHQAAQKEEEMKRQTENESEVNKKAAKKAHELFIKKEGINFSLDDYCVHIVDGKYSEAWAYSDPRLLFKLSNWFAKHKQQGALEALAPFLKKGQPK